MNMEYGIECSLSLENLIIGKQCNPYFFQLLFESQSDQLVTQSKELLFHIPCTAWTLVHELILCNMRPDRK